MIHRFYQEQEQINDGKMDRFVAISGAGAPPMGYFDGRRLPLYRLAAEYTLADRFFHAAFGGGFLNHFWLICACTPRYDDAPASMVAELDDRGKMVRDGVVTPDGYAVNTIDPVSEPHDPKISNHRQLLPLQRMPTIGRLLTDAGVSWAWYAGGFAKAAAGRPTRPSSTIISRSSILPTTPKEHPASRAPLRWAQSNPSYQGQDPSSRKLLQAD